MGPGELLLTLGALMVLMSPVVFMVRRNHRAQLDAMTLASEDLGLPVHSTSMWGAGPSLRGTVDDLHVEVKRSGGGDNRSTFLTARVTGNVARDLRLADRDLRGTVKDTVATGDSLFDGAWHVDGPADLALALLDEETRAALMEHASDTAVMIRDGAVVVNCRQAGALSRCDLVVDTARAAVDIARRLQAPAGRVARALAQRARADSEVAVQARALSLLIAGHRETTPCEEALTALADHPSPDIKRLVMQARGVQAEGRLTVSEPEGDGGLSVADGAAGAVSVAKES